MRHQPRGIAVDSSSPRVGRLARLLGRLRRRHRAGEEPSAFAFGVRLFAALALTFTAVGITAYVLLERSVAQRQITDYAAAQRADARVFEAVGALSYSTTEAIQEIHAILDSVAKRPGTVKALLIDQHHVIRAEISWEHVGDPTVPEPTLDAAVNAGRSFAGRDSAPKEDHRNFQFVTPVNLPSGRYAYEVIYDHRAYDAQLNEVRTILGLIGLLAVIAGGGVFYLVGGRRLMRDHRTVLRRSTRDGLTDLPNQRAFQDEFPQAVASAARYQDPFALALLDVDEFKRINDRHGHPHGDAILKRVAAVLRQSRPGDRPYRIGGDEFALVLAHTDAEGAGILA